MYASYGTTYGSNYNDSSNSSPTPQSEGRPHHNNNGAFTFYSTQHNIQILHVTYGPKTITNPHILERLRHDLSERQDTFRVSNEDCDGDSQQGTYKYLTVDYRDHPNGPVSDTTLTARWLSSY